MNGAAGGTGNLQRFTRCQINARTGTRGVNHNARADGLRHLIGRRCGDVINNRAGAGSQRLVEFGEVGVFVQRARFQPVDQPVVIRL